MRILILLTLFTVVARGAEPATVSAVDRTSAIQNCAGTYASPPRTTDKRVDVPLLIQQLKDLHANTYNWLIWSQATDWDDLKVFLPAARREGIKVWVTLVPPSESPPKTRKYSEPFKLDYDRWAVEIAKLSADQPNLVAWSIDDFAYNTKLFTPEKTRQMLQAARAINPHLAFVPVFYWSFLKPPLTAYRGILDGVLYPYRHDSVKMNLIDTDTVKPEVAKLHSLLGDDLVVVVDVYQTKHSRTGPSSPQYVKDVMTEAHHIGAAVMIYTHPNPKTDPEKFAAVRDCFSKWATNEHP